MPATPATPAELADRFLNLLAERAATNEADEVRERFVENYQLVEAAIDTDPAARDAIVARLAERMTADLSDWDFACAANTCGLAVERGADPHAAAGAVLDRLPSLMAKAADIANGLHAKFGTPDLEAVPEDQWEPAAKADADAAELIRGFLGLAYAARAAMTMLSRSVPLRQQARTRGDLLRTVVPAREVNRYAFYLAELLGCTDDERVVVIDHARNLGFLVRLTAVRNNFHFFTLLQHALLARPEYADWDGETPTPLLGSLAAGDTLLSQIPAGGWEAAGVHLHDGEPCDRGLWAFYQWPALQPDGTIETAEAAAPHQPWWAWGEARPLDLPDLDGVRLLLLGPPEGPRAWGVGFFTPLHPALRSSVVVEKVLPAETVAGWVTDIRAVPREPTAAAEPNGVA